MNHLRPPIVVGLIAFLAGLLPSLRLELAPLLLFGVFLTLLAALGTSHSKRWRVYADGRVRLLLLLATAGAIAGSLARRDADSDCRTGFVEGQRLRVEGTLGAAYRKGSASAGAPLLPLLASSVNGSPRCGGEIRVRLAAVPSGVSVPPVVPDALPIPAPPNVPTASNVRATSNAAAPSNLPASSVLPAQAGARRTPRGEGTLAASTRLSVTGRWRPFPSSAVESDWPRDPRYLGFLLADSVTVLSDGTAAAPLWLRIRGKIDERLERIFPDHLALVEGLLLGRREYIDPVVTDRYTRSGLTHLLAISGTHVALLAAALLLLGSILRVSRKTAAYCTLVLTWVYLMVIGAPASAVRAGIMISLALFSILLQRPTAPTAIVAGAALGILAFQPLAVLDIGFQLSFAGVLGIMLLRAPLLAVAPDQLHANGILRGLTDAFVMGIGAFLVTAPIVAHHFQVIAPVSILAGVPAIPLTSLALIGVSAALVFDPLLPPVAGLVASGTGAALDLLDWLAAVAAAVPYGNGPVPRPPWWSWTIAAGIGFGAGHLTRSGGRRLRWITGVGSTIATLAIWPLLTTGGPGRFEVHFLDVGQGDAIAIRSPQNRWILVDAGPASDDFDAGERRVVPFLRANGVRRLEALVLTHPDLDHIGGAGAVLGAIPVNFVFEPGLAVGKDTYVDLLGAVQVQGTEWRAARSGRSMELDGVRFDFLWPDPESIDAAEDANQISAVMRVTYGAFSILLTGDAGAEVETLLVQRHQDSIRSLMLKLGHHGSETSTADAFLEAVQPEIAIVSAGRRNRYGHPAPSVMERVRRRGIPVARTDQEGTVSFRVSEDGTSWQRLLE